MGEAGGGDGWEDEGLEMEVGRFHTAILFDLFGAGWKEARHDLRLLSEAAVTLFSSSFFCFIATSIVVGEYNRITL